MSTELDLVLMTRSHYQAYAEAENRDLARRNEEHREAEWDLLTRGHHWTRWPRPLPRCCVCLAHQTTITVYRDEPDRVDYTACGHRVRIINDPPQEQS